MATISIYQLLAADEGLALSSVSWGRWWCHLRYAFYPPRSGSLGEEDFASEGHNGKKARKTIIVSILEHLEQWLWELTEGHRNKKGFLQVVCSWGLP